MKTEQVVVNFMRCCCIVAGCALISVDAGAVTADPMQQLIKPKQAIKRLQHSAMFEGRGDGVRTCPVTGEKVTAKGLKAEYFGRTVYFCCHGCLKAAQRNPERFVKATMAEQQSAVKAYVAKVAQAPDGAEFCDE